MTLPNPLPLHASGSTAACVRLKPHRTRAAARAATCARGGQAFQLYYVKCIIPVKQKAGSRQLCTVDRFARWPVRNGGINRKIN
jgi:hypothetical protein